MDIIVKEFKVRLERLRNLMVQENLDALFIYGDEYRRENLRYISNYWPIFERGACVLSLNSDPIVLCAPEGYKVAGEMSVWNDIRMLKEFICVTVPDEIDYPLATYTSLRKIAEEIRQNNNLKRLGLVGIDAIPVNLFNMINNEFCCELVDSNKLFFKMRLIKSQAEIMLIQEAARIADLGFKALMESNIIGMTEREAAAIAEGAARAAGAESIVFTVFGSGERTNTIIGRATNKIICNGEMIMCSLAVQYEGYIATCEMPFAVGNYSKDTKRVINVLVRAANAGRPYLKPGIKMKEYVRAVRSIFRDEGLSEYDVYPPLHGIGCAEAEPPYPSETSEDVFQVGMTVNTDISLFGLKGGSNRIEEGIVIVENGAESLSPFVRNCCEKWETSF